MLAGFDDITLALISAFSVERFFFISGDHCSVAPTICLMLHVNYLFERLIMKNLDDSVYIIELPR